MLRYPISVPVRFRERGGAWVDGMTVNIGADGLLLRTQSAPPRSAPLELRIALLGDLASGPHVACSGRVVKSSPGEGADGVLVAVTIDQFQLRP